jgi:hypothetical protein
MLINYTPVGRDSRFALEINSILQRGEFYIYVLIVWFNSFSFADVRKVDSSSVSPGCNNVY